MFKKISFKTKLLILCFFMAISSVLISSIAYIGFHKVDESNQRIINQIIPSTNYMNSMAIHFNKIRVELRTLGIAGISESVAEQTIKNAEKEIQAYELDEIKYRSIPFLVGESELYGQIHSKWQQFKRIGEKVIELHKNKKLYETQTMHSIFLKECPEAAADFKVSLEKMLEFHSLNVKIYENDSLNIKNSINTLIVTVSTISILISLIVGYIFSHSISKKINDLIKQLKHSTQNVASAATQIAASSEQLSHATIEQEVTLQQTSSAIKEINHIIDSNSNHAKQSEHSAHDLIECTFKGKDSIKKMISTMNEIQSSNQSIMDQIDQNNKEMEDIIKLINEIGTKTKVINDIVFQTKLLSFNASVEAARAGQQGKGFSVVAEEIGKLAEMSGSAAIEIAKLLENSVLNVETIIKNSHDKMGILIEAGKQNVENGIKSVDKCNGVLAEIVTAVNIVTKSIIEISSASQEQSKGVSDITKSLIELDKVTQENTANSVESAGAAESLSDQANDLTLIVENLVTTIEGIKNVSQTKTA